MIGPGGENLVPYACIMNGPFDAAGRGGLGAVMGSKNLKAIAVRGQRPAARLRPRGREGHQLLAARGALGELLAAAGADGVRHRAGRRWRAWKRSATFRCTTGGGLRSRGHQEHPRRRAEGEDGPRARRAASTARCAARSGCSPALPTSSTRRTAGPSTRPCAGWAATARWTTSEAMVKANELCNAYSLDVISSGHHHLVRHGVLREGPADPRGHGRPRPAFRQRPGPGQVLELIAKREGIGALLAEGSAPGGAEDRPRGGSALGGSEGRPSGHARTAPSARLRPRLHGQPQRRRPLRQRARRPLRLRARDARTSTAWASTTRCRSRTSARARWRLFKVGHIREFLNDCLLTVPPGVCRRHFRARRSRSSARSPAGTSARPN